MTITDTDVHRIQTSILAGARSVVAPKPRDLILELTDGRARLNDQSAEDVAEYLAKLVRFEVRQQLRMVRDSLCESCADGARVVHDDSSAQGRPESARGSTVEAGSPGGRDSGPRASIWVRLMRGGLMNRRLLDRAHDATWARENGGIVVRAGASSVPARDLVHAIGIVTAHNTARRDPEFARSLRVESVVAA